MGHWYDRLKRITAPRADNRVRGDGAYGGSFSRNDPEDGIIVLTDSPPRPAITLRGFAGLVAAFLLLKAAIIAALGPETYATAVFELERGALPEQVAAFVMAPDALSQQLALAIGALPN